MVAVRRVSTVKPVFPVSTPIDAKAAEQMRLLAREFPPRIERRRRHRIGYRTHAWLSAVDEQSAVRPPLIFSRDVDSSGLGFLANKDVSAIGHGVLLLPDGTGRSINISCHVRRSRDLNCTWFEGLLEFDKPQLCFAADQ